MPDRQSHAREALSLVHFHHPQPSKTCLSGFKRCHGYRMVMYLSYEASGSVGSRGRSTLGMHKLRCQSVTSTASVISCIPYTRSDSNKAFKPPTAVLSLSDPIPVDSPLDQTSPSAADILGVLFFLQRSSSDTTKVLLLYYPFFHLTLGSCPTGNFSFVYLEVHI